MPGPAPKDPSTRRRTNRTVTATELTYRKGRRPMIPIRRAHRMTREFWASLWASPMASQYTDADVQGLMVLCLVVEDFWTAESARERREAAAEIRQQSVRFGLSPIDRRRLQWTLPKGQGGAEPVGKPAADSGRGRPLRAVPAGPDPRDVLTA